MGETSTRSTEGVPKTMVTSSPLGTAAYFTGSGDDISGSIVGEGTKLIFKMMEADVSQTKTVEFLEDVYIKDGFALFGDAPLGAFLNIEILDASGTHVSFYSKRTPLFFAGRIDLNAERHRLLPMGYKIKVSVFNSNDQLDDEGERMKFNVAVCIEMCRANT